MNRKSLLILAMTFVFSILLAACGSNNNEEASGNAQGQGNSDKVYEINLNVAAPPTHPFTTEIAEPWKELVETETNGQIVVNVFPSAALGSLSTAFNDIQNGVYEAGQISPGRHVDTDLFPLSIGDIPFTITSPEVGQEVLNAFINEFLTDIFDQMTFMGMSTTDAWNLYGKEPVETVEDLKGTKINDSAPERLELIEAWGATGVSLSNTEIYEGIERGTIEKSFYTSVGANGFSLHEVAPHMTQLEIGATTLMFAMNKDFLDSLPEDLRTLMVEDLGPEFTNLAVKMYTESAAKAIQEFENLVGEEGSVVQPTEEQMEEFKKPVADIAKEWVKKANERGYDGDAMLEFYGEKLKEAGVEVPF
jgi:TRAP-type transport system periplasmic protein